MKFASSEVRRARPLLGTFVDITAQGAEKTDLHRAVDLAFGTIQSVDRLMSFHDPGSDVSRINRDGFPKGVIVHPWTWRVLKCAQEFSRKSDGVFDVTIGRQLVKWAYLPKPGKRFGSGGSWRDIVLDNKCNVRFYRPLIVDLGGIAKGFAVDCAIETLKHNGVVTGIVNAGGDLRAFGATSQLIHLRHPARPTRIARAVRLRERAMATSGIYFERRKYRGKYVGPLLNGRTGQSARELISVSVAAKECMVADALTKIVFTLREKTADLLAQYDADALLLERDGAPSWIFHSLCDTRDRTRFA
jgi:thiamine biosynthesis lipoprotein